VEPWGGDGQCGGRRGSPERRRDGEAGRGSVVAAVPIGGDGSSDVPYQGEAMGEVRRELCRTGRLWRRWRQWHGFRWLWQCFGDGHGLEEGEKRGGAHTVGEEGNWGGGSGNAVEAVGDQRLASHGRGGGEHGWQHGLA
jgi:hypothetical protein